MRCFVYTKDDKYKVFFVGSCCYEIHSQEVDKIQKDFSDYKWINDFEYTSTVDEKLREYFESLGKKDISFVFYLNYYDFTSERATSIRRYLYSLTKLIFGNAYSSQNYIEVAKSCYFIIQDAYFPPQNRLRFPLSEKGDPSGFLANYIFDELNKEANNTYYNEHVFPVSQASKAISADNFYAMQVKKHDEVTSEPTDTEDAKNQSLMLRAILLNVIKLSCLNLSIIIAGSLILALTSGMILQAVGIGLVVSGGIGLGVTFFRAFKEHNSLKNKMITPSEIPIAYPVNIDYI